MNDETLEAPAKAAYSAWRRHFEHVTLWNELTPQAQVVWLNVAHAAIDAYKMENGR